MDCAKRVCWRSDSDGVTVLSGDIVDSMASWSPCGRKSYARRVGGRIRRSSGSVTMGHFFFFARFTCGGWKAVNIGVRGLKTKKKVHLVGCS